MLPAVNQPLLRLFLVFVALPGLINFVSATPRPKTIRVHSGESIQTALNSVSPGDHIIVESGTYAEQLNITTDDISLIGRDAILNPPLTVTTNLCTGLAGKLPPANTIDTQAGICLHGSNVQLANFAREHRKVLSVGKPVKGVSISGFTIRGFLGLNIAVVGAQDAMITDNTLTDGAFYGALTVGSKNSLIERNTINSSPPTATNTFLPFIGVCMDDVKTVIIRKNDISGYLIGLYVQTSGANIYDNKIENCCIGAFVDPGIVGAKLRDNVFKYTNPRCFDQAASGSFLVSGIYIAGANETIVTSNKITGITAGGNTNLGGVGLVVNDDFPIEFGGSAAVASGNRVKENKVKINDLDILVGATGLGNVVKNNRCVTSVPENICSKGD
jgi:nitrous oxidase accessory protein NosD